MVERFVEQQSAICATLLSPEVRRNRGPNQTEVLNEDAVKVLKPMKDATTLMSKESNPTIVCVPLNAPLLQNMTDTTGGSPLTQEIKHAIKVIEISSEAEKNILYTASALDLRF